MKTGLRLVFIFLFTVILSATSNKSFSQCDAGLTSIHVNAFDKGQSITFTDPISGNPYSGYAGTVTSTLDGNPMPVYCVDLHRNVTLGDQSYTDTCAYVTSRVQYILNNYFPYKNSYAGELSDLNQEAASIQAAIWKYTDNVNASTITDATIRTRTLQIIADADVNGNVAQPIITFTFEASFDPEYFYIRTTDENGNGIAINNIALSISAGSLGMDTVNTDASGNSPDVQVIGTNTGTITAIARMLFPQGRIIHSTTLTEQSLTIAYPVYGKMITTSDWGALPVELSAFTASVNGANVTLKWTTASEINNAGFSIERKSSANNVWTTIGNVSGNGTSTAPHSYSYTDANVLSGNYNYRLKQTDFNGNYEFHNLSSEIGIGTPDKFKLSQNYPNPFNPSTTINFDMPVDGFVSLKVYNTSGKEVATLVNNTLTAGYHTVNFNASSLSSGVYNYRLESNGISKVMKMALIK